MRRRVDRKEELVEMISRRKKKKTMGLERGILVKLDFVIN